MKCIAFEPLIKDMNKNNIDKEHYTFVYNKLKFDVILSILNTGYEILIAIHTHNWGCVLSMNEYYWIEIPNEIYFSLCDVLKLSWNKDHFNSSKFLQLLSEKSPKHSNCQGVQYTTLRQYLPYRHVDEEDKIYFCGWNDHKKDKRNAQNYDKTEFFFGKTVADYCRSNNISSMWSDIPRNEEKLTMPWNN